MAAEKDALISPCGLDCGDCPAYKAKDEPALMAKMLSFGFKKESMPCPGCRAMRGECAVIEGKCDTYACFEGRNISFCHECAEFPCARYVPAADKAGASFHNLRVFNLSFMRARGLEEWKKAAPWIRKRYFQGKLEYGKGPVIKSEDTHAQDKARCERHSLSHAHDLDRGDRQR